MEVTDYRFGSIEIEGRLPWHRAAADKAK